MISIRLHPDLFDKTKNGPFYGTPRNRAVLNIGSGRNEAYAGKLPGIWDSGHLSWRGGQWILLVDVNGTQVSDITFEGYMQEDSLKDAYGRQIIDFAERGAIIVEQDGTPLTVAQMRAFTA